MLGFICRCIYNEGNCCIYKNCRISRFAGQDVLHNVGNVCWQQHFDFYKYVPLHCEHVVFGSL